MSPNKPVRDDAQDRATHRLDDMDARPAVEAVRARLSASPDGSLAEPDEARSAMTGTPNGIRSSPPTLGQHTAMDIDLPNGSVEEIAAGKSDSEAETIVLPGKDGYSPSKIRKSIKHEDKSGDDGEEMKDVSKKNGLGSNVVRGSTEMGVNPSESTSGGTATSMLGKRKRSKHGFNDEHVGNSSGLSSVPTSPVATTRSSLSKPMGSDSEISRSPSPGPRSRSAIRDKAKSVDRIISRKKRYDSGSGDEGEVEAQRFRRQRSSGADHKSSRDVGSKLLLDSNPRKRSRSISPHSRGHKRSISTQLPSKPSHGLSHKKKRVPAPLQSTEYHSDESSASGRSHQRSSRIRHLAAPATGDSNHSPAKMPPHKKHINASGQTPLAIAVGRDQLEIVKQRYEERRSDLNFADNAMNTPLHVASLHGFTEIVRFLLETGDCELDSVNLDKDTPLHDAVDNGHLDVVKLLLDAGANPSKANKAGNEPIDIVNEKSEEDEEDAEVWAEMKEAIMAAKRALNKAPQRASEDPHHHDSDGRMSHPKESPRQTPPVQNTDSQRQGPTSRRIGNVRLMNKTKDTTLYQRLDVDELREAARDGDAGTVSRILEVMPTVNDAQTLYYAARGGHVDVVNLLFAMGAFDPDPPALDGFSLEQATPILAAIGKDNHLEVIKLLIGMSGFDPTRRLRGETYSEIARRRGGPKSKEEEQLFKNAFEEYKKSHKSAKPRSPGLRRDGRDGDREVRKAVRNDDQQTSKTHQRTNSNPKVKDSDSSKGLQKNSGSSSAPAKEGLNPTKRGPGRPKKGESVTSGAISDRETTPLGPPKHKAQSKKSESDVGVASDHEPATKPRRKLVSGKEFRGERELERQRRASVASNASGASVKENRERAHPDSKIDKLDGKSGPNVPRVPKHQSNSQGEKDLTTDKQSAERDRARSLKRDDSKDRLSAIRGESPVKRPRKSETPPRSSLQEVYPQKRRKIDSDSVSHKTDSTPSSSPEIRSATSKSTLSRENTSSKSNPETKSKKLRPPESAGTPKDALDKFSTDRPSKSSSHTSSASSEAPAKRPKLSHDRPSKVSPEEQVNASKADEEAQRQAKLRREKKEAEGLRQKEIEEEKEREAAKRAREKELEEEKQREEARQAREKELEEERVKMEQARVAREAREKAAREEEEKRQREEAEKKERQRIEDAEAHQRAIEAQKALYVEQERLKREEAERRRAQLVEQQRAERARIEREKREEMLSKLPLLLKWFELESDPKTTEVAKLFKKITGFRYDTIKPEFTGQAIGREQWMLNYHVAILLGEKDLQLSRCESFVVVHEDLC